MQEPRQIGRACVHGEVVVIACQAVCQHVGAIAQQALFNTASTVRRAALSESIRSRPTPCAGSHVVDGARKLDSQGAGHDDFSLNWRDWVAINTGGAALVRENCGRAFASDLAFETLCLSSTFTIRLHI